MLTVMDKDGNEIDWLEERNNEIKAELQSVVDMFKEEEAADKKGAKRFGFRLLMQIEDELGKYGVISADDFVMLDYGMIEYHWNKFHSLMAYYNRYFEIVPNRQTFMLYMRINSRMYRQLQESQDEDIRSLMLFIEDRLIGKGFSAGENGNTNEKAVMGRLRASGAGHGVVSASEEMAAGVVESLSPQELMRRAMAIVGDKKEIKKLTGGN